MMMKTALFAALAITAVLTTDSARAAVITWGAATQITGLATDISTNGTLVESISGDIDDDYTVNGVTFIQGQILDTTTHNDNISTRVPALTDSVYRTLLQMGSRNSNSADQPITFSGLNIGYTYEIQVWASDNGSTLANNALVLGNGTVSAVNPATLGHRTLLYETGAEGQPGQYALGTFIADATSQSFNVRRWTNLLTTATASNNNFINAIQIRETAQLPPVPEPGSLTMGLIGLMLMAIRRRRG